MTNERPEHYYYCDWCRTLTRESKLHLKEGQIYCDNCFEELFGREF